MLPPQHEPQTPYMAAECFEHRDASIESGLWFLFCCQGMTTLGLMAMVPIMPIYLQQFSDNSLAESGIWASLAIAAPALGALFLAPYLGKACDRWGYRLMVQLSLGGFTVSLVLMALSQSIATFLAGRLLLGVSGIGVTLAAFVSASSTINRGHSLGVLQAGTACGAFLGPLLGGFLQGQWSLQPLLLLTALFSGMAVLGAYIYLREPRRRDGNITAQTRPSTELSAASSSCNFFTALRHRGMRGWLLAACCIQAATFALVVVFVLFLAPIVEREIEVHTSANLPWPQILSLPFIAGGIHALGWLMSSLTSSCWGTANDRGIPRRHFLIASCACGLSLLAMSLAENLWLILFCRLVQGAFFAALIQTVYLEICRCALPAAAATPGHIIGLCKSYLVLGQIVGPALMMLLLPQVHPQQLLQVVAILFVVAALIVCALAKPCVDIDATSLEK